MKQLKFNLDNLFRLSTISAIQTFEFENNSAELVVSTDVKNELVYELHIESPEGKSFVILEKADGAVKSLLNSGMLKLGVNKIQLRGIGADGYSIESNRVEFTVKSFINASVEPEPSEHTEFEKLVVTVNGITNEVKAIESTLKEHSTRMNELDEDKQDKLIPGETLATINGKNLLEGGDIKVEGDVSKKYVDQQDEAIKELIPSKTSELENDSEFVTRQELDSKMEFYKLDYVGGLLKHEGVALNYEQIIEKFYDNKYFLYAEGDGFTYIPTLPPLECDEIIEFSCSYLYGGAAYISRIIVNSQNQIKHEEVQIVRSDEVPSLIKGKQNVLTPGKNIKIEDDVISAEFESVPELIDTAEHLNPTPVRKTNTAITSIDLANSTFTFKVTPASGYENLILKFQNLVVGCVYRVEYDVKLLNTPTFSGAYAYETYISNNVYPEDKANIGLDNLPTTINQTVHIVDKFVYLGDRDIVYMCFFAPKLSTDACSFEVSNIKIYKSAYAKPSDSITDIQINGNSIVSDGVANISYPTTTKGGVVKNYSGYGMWIGASDGIPYALERNQTQYNSDSKNAFVGKGTLENIKSDLTKRALTDDTQAEWTDAEKASARARMGALGGTFELLEEFTTSEEFTAIERTSEPNGTPYNLQAIRIVLDCGGTAFKASSAWFNVKRSGASDFYIDIAGMTAFSSAQMIVLDLRNDHGLTSYYQKNGRNNPSIATVAEANLYYRTAIESVEYKNVTGFRIYNQTFNAGLKVKIYGIRA